MERKRIFAALLAVMMCLGQAPIVARAAVTPSDAQAYLDVLNRTKPDSSSSSTLTATAGMSC